uniref:Integrase, catalytic region, zinc finger, CCHC-type, peptidase aspartic, catalytic n=1 Tax=Tanacetum cinerariifolium TaxID=118510 RepID=A0A6L2M2I3_TANCI|nr:integrase, catalytic region, zinc finger, CCHC-type, peptidase aspartic, catalytic [Tanacetum cinerariifolium]
MGGTKDHPIENVIGDPSRSVSMRKQLKTDAMWCYFDAFVTSVETKNFKQAMTEPSWIDAIQEEIPKFERLQVWELVPCLVKVMLIKLKWIYKVKTYEFGRNRGHPYLHSKCNQQEYDDLPNGRHNDFLKWRAQRRETCMVEKNKLDEDLQGTPVDAILYRGCQDTRRSTSGIAQFLGDKLVGWSSRKQKSTTISSTKSGYISLSGCCAQILSMRQQKCNCSMLQQHSTLKSNVHPGMLPFYKGAGGELNSGTLVCLDEISTGWHLHQILASRMIQLPDRKGQPIACAQAKKALYSLKQAPPANMNLVVAKQVALDNYLVPSEKRLKIEKCSARIEFSKPKREETYQVTLDALKLSLCYPAFLITTKVPEEDYMYQADNREICLARKVHMPYPRFTKVIISHFISKDKTISMRNMINLQTIHDDSLLGTLKFVSKTQDYQQYGALIPDDMINQDAKDSKAYKTYYDFATRKATPKNARKFKKVASPLRKLSPVLEEESAVKPKRAKKPAKKSTIVPTAGIAIRDTPTAQLKKTLKKSKLKTHKLHASGSGDGFGSQTKVLNEQEDMTTSTNKGTDSSDDDDENDDDSDEVTKDDDEDDVESDVDDDKEASDSEKIDLDKDENLNLNQNDDEEEEYEEEYVRTPYSFEFNDDDEEYEELYEDVNIRLQDTWHEEEGK